jgi:hypothetical protein
MRALIALCLIPVFALGQASAPAAKEQTPDSVQSLPAEIRRDLDLRQCRIPKYSGSVDAEYQTYTTGHFRSKLSVDYAIVCHIPAHKVQCILVYSKFEGLGAVKSSPANRLIHRPDRTHAHLPSAWQLRQRYH